MTTKRNAILLFAAALLAAPQMSAQNVQQPSKPPSESTMPGMDMGDMQRDAAAQSAHDAMAGHHMDMGAHMFMTDLRRKNSEDDRRAASAVRAGTK